MSHFQRRFFCVLLLFYLIVKSQEDNRANTKKGIKYKCSHFYVSYVEKIICLTSICLKDYCVKNIQKL